MNGRYISVNAHDGRQFQAYLATAIGGSGPGVVLCQEIFGINQAMRDVADFLARKATACWCPICIGGRSQASNWVTAKKIFSRPSAFTRRLTRTPASMT
ncbi:Carboxymethylenebutenolidase [Pseudomonas syringae pv. actinidiae]|nr:Carboxymethylenebutenolidase [Pseudomonas syringae pv. actinidiae]